MAACGLTVSTYRLPPTDGVRVSGGHLCEAEAPTEAAAETVSKRSFDGGEITKTDGNLISLYI